MGDQKEKAAGLRTASEVEKELQLLEFRKSRVQKRLSDSKEHREILAVLEARCCSLRSSLQLLE